MRDSAVVGRPRGYVIRSVIVSALVMAAMLLGAFAVHSAGAGHEMGIPVPAAPAHDQHLVEASEVAGIGAGTAVAAHAATGLIGVGDGLMAGCGILAMTCSVLLIVVALIRLARQPSAYRRLLDAVGLVARSSRTIPLPVHRPSLTLLSISRI